MRQSKLLQPDVTNFNAEYPHASRTDVSKVPGASRVVSAGKRTKLQHAAIARLFVISAQRQLEVSTLVRVHRNAALDCVHDFGQGQVAHRLTGAGSAVKC